MPMPQSSPEGTNERGLRAFVRESAGSALSRMKTYNGSCGTVPLTLLAPANRPKSEVTCS